MHRLGPLHGEPLRLDRYAVAGKSVVGMSGCLFVAAIFIRLLVVTLGRSPSWSLVLRFFGLT